MQSTDFAKMQDHFKEWPQRLYPKGQIILFAGEVPRYGYFLHSGYVRVYDISPRGDELVVDVITAPACFPMSWIINRSPNRYFYKAGVQSSVHLLPIEQFTEYLQANPELLFEILASTQENLDSAFDRMVYTMAGTAQLKLVHQLLLECQHPTDQALSRSHTIHIKSSEIAARAGLARETVSREIKKLCQSNIIQIKDRKIYIPDTRNLEQILQTFQTPLTSEVDSYHPINPPDIKE